jgi:hypothetical protein
MKALSRRRLLRGLGSIAVALPLLDAMRGSLGSRAYAQAAAKKRFVVA